MLALMEVSKCGAPAFLITKRPVYSQHASFRLSRTAAQDGRKYAGHRRSGYALALTEPGAGSDNSAATTTYTRKNGKVYLNGQKTFITGAKEYPYMLVLARDPEPKIRKRPSPCGGWNPISRALRSIRCTRSAGTC
ncbi:Crotonobetainyl-CoA dehydrogenase [Serratia fonticola]|uniref:Crotonobetainyl-CoA dehydrogenase n=1 Tax=Serratia fonticola TaxID=47917 RepID=A0A4U9TST5_SERFO|nr:Crotonobetainyl-CoA dehydrogenase [Serratia fonticola]